MKYCIIILDGLADRKYTRLHKKTPLEISRTLCMDEMAKQGRLGMVSTIPKELPCNTVVSSMSILGINPALYYPGIGPCEAEDICDNIPENAWFFCCDFVSMLDETTMADSDITNIRLQESELLIQDLQNHFGTEKFLFHHMKGNHHLMIFPDSKFHNLKTEDPFYVRTKAYKDYYPTGEGSEILIQIMEEAKEILTDHDVNMIRQDLGEPVTNALWIWSGGQIPFLSPWSELFGMQGAMVAHEPSVRGLAKILGLTNFDVPTSTGTWTTDYKAKVNQAINALKTHDIVFVHINALWDIARHHEVSEKVRALESIDSFFLTPLLQQLPTPYRVMVVGGHNISVDNGIDRDDEVPFIVYDSTTKAGCNLAFSEHNAQKVDFHIHSGEELLNFFIQK